MTDMNGFKFQASKNSPDGWILVARGNSEEELEFGIGIIDKQIKKLGGLEDMLGPQATTATCKTCGALADRKEGIAKSGKPYKGIFCRVNKDHVTWL